MQIEKLIRDNWHTFFPGKEAPGKLPVIFVRSYKKNSLFFMDERSGFPICVVSISTELTGERLQKEASALEKLEELNLENLQDAYPRLYFFGQVDGHEVLVQSFVCGRKMSKNAKARKGLFWKNSFQSNMLRMSSWLVKFHQATRISEIKIHKEYANELLKPVFERLGGSTESFKVLSVLINSLEGRRIFNVFAHGDLHLDNILIKNDGSIALIDWDLSSRQGLPLWDILDLAVFYCRLIRGGWQKGEDLSGYVKDAFLNNNSISAINIQTINDYMTKMKLDLQVARLLFIMWVEKRFQSAKLLDASFEKLNWLFAV